NTPAQGHRGLRQRSKRGKTDIQFRARPHRTSLICSGNDTSPLYEFDSRYSGKGTVMPEETVLPVTPAGIEYAYSSNGEDWTADWCSFLSQNDELAQGDQCRRGEIHYADPAEFVDSDSVIDSMADNAASSDLGEWADDFPNVSAEAKQELEDLL